MRFFVQLHVRQLTRFQLTARRAVPLQQLSFLCRVHGRIVYYRQV